MPDDGKDVSCNQEKTPDDGEITRRQVEHLLSKCESNRPQVYVMEIMSMLPGLSRSKHGTAQTFNEQYMVSAGTILSLVKQVAHEVWVAPTAIEDGILNQNLALVADRGHLESLWLGCEGLWLREIETDEVFEEEDRFLLQPHKVREIASDFVLTALKTRLSENHGVAQLAVLHAAGELLLEHLGEDICLIPDRFSEVVEAVEEVLSAEDWFTLTEESILSLSEAVVRRVGDQ